MTTPASCDIDSDDELESMRDLFGGDFAILAELYLRDSPQRIVALREAMLAADASQAASVAHSLGGSCASIGAPGLAMLCQNVEIRCRGGNMDDLHIQVQHIEAAYTRIENKLRAMLQS